MTGESRINRFKQTTVGAGNMENFLDEIRKNVIRGFDAEFELANSRELHIHPLASDGNDGPHGKITYGD